MRESVIYQEICQEGRHEGERKLIVRLVRKFGAIASTFQSQIQSLSQTQLEDLSEKFLSFSEITDLEAWLEANQHPK